MAKEIKIHYDEEFNFYVETIESESPIEGFGDFAANLTQQERLKAAFPNAEILKIQSGANYGPHVRDCIDDLTNEFNENLKKQSRWYKVT